MTLATDEFIRRFLIHVLPKGFHRIRHYGLLASTNRAANIAHARELLAVPSRPNNPTRPKNNRPTSRTVAAMPVLRRPHDHHRDLRARLRAEAPAHTTFGGDQGRHLMMPSPPINDSYDTCNSHWLSASSAQVRVDPLDCPGRNTNLVVLPADRSFTPTCSHWLCRKPIAPTDPVQPHQPKTRG